MTYPTKKLGEVLEKIVGGGTPSKSNPGYWGGDIPWASVKDIKEDSFVLVETEDYITQDGLKNSASNLIPKGTLVISTRMGLGRAVKTEIDTAINQDLKALFPKKELDIDYLLLFLKSHAKQIIQKGSGATVSGIKLEHIRDIDIPTPTLSDQKKVVKKIDGLFAKIELAQKLREESKKETSNLLQSALNEIFGKPGKNWEEKELGELLEKIVGGGTPSKANSRYWNGGIPWASVKDLKEGQYVLRQTRDFISKEGLENSSANLIPKGTLIISTRMGLGRIAKSELDVVINQDLKALFPKKQIDNDFLRWFLLSKAQEIVSAGTGATVSGIRLEYLRKIPVTLPPIVEQKKIVARLDLLSTEIRELQKLQSETEKDLKDLKQSILQKAFAGELI